jgi:transposase-like protein
MSVQIEIEKVDQSLLSPYKNLSLLNQKQPNFAKQAMNCPLCSYARTRKHGKTSKGSQRFFCPSCRQTFSETLNTLYYRRQVNKEDIQIVLQSYSDGMSFRGISRISGLAYNTVVRIIQAANQRASESSAEVKEGARG